MCVCCRLAKDGKLDKLADGEGDEVCVKKEEDTGSDEWESIGVKREVV